MDNENKIQGWGDVVITPDMPISVIINFLNVLNQRIVSIENVLMVKDENGKEISLTELYRQQTEVEMKKMAKAKESEGK